MSGDTRGQGRAHYVVEHGSPEELRRPNYSDAWRWCVREGVQKGGETRGLKDAAVPGG